MKPESLRARLFAAIALVALLSLALALAIGAVLTRRAVERNTVRDVSAQLDLLAERERDAVLPFSRLRSLQEFLDRQDQRVVRSPLDGSSPLLPPDQAARLRRGARLDGTIESDGTRYLYAARLVGGKGFMLLRPASSTNSAWRPQVQGLIVAAIATVRARGADRVPARAGDRQARPARRRGDARPRELDRAPPLVPVEGPRELAQLAESFNDLAVALTKAREAERAFLLSVSHELKTPLTAIRGYAEGLQEGCCPRGSGHNHRGRVAPAGAARRRPARPRTDEQGGVQRAPRADRPVRDRTGGGSPLRRTGAGLRGDPGAGCLSGRTGDRGRDRVLQIVSNLVENALRLAPAGGSVRIVTGPGELRVEDNGPGLKPEELERAFERFYLYSRYGRERPVGTGLGLAIVKELAQGMGGSVGASSAPGQLTVFTVRLPLAAAGGPEHADTTLIRA